MRFFLKNREQGLGLVETIIVMIIILGSVVSLISFQINLTYNDELTQCKNIAMNLALSEMETLRDFDVLTTQSPYVAYQSIASGTSSSTIGNTTYSLTWTVNSFTNPTYDNVSIVVTWTDRRNLTQSVTLVSDIAGIVPSYSASVMSG